MRTIIAANWKMHLLRSEAVSLAKALLAHVTSGLPEGREVVLFPAFLSIAAVAEAVAASPIKVGAQNFFPAEKGAYTGEVSLPMLKDCGATITLVGHSERRHILHESDATIATKTSFALEQGFDVMLCIGETLQERESGALEEVLTRQLTTALSPLPKEYATKLSIAYEPVWAIGTGKVAGPKEVLEAHGLCKSVLKGIGFADLPVLYGGSVKPNNAHDLLSLENVDGLLVGGASLQAESFSAIISA